MLLYLRSMQGQAARPQNQTSQVAYMHGLHYLCLPESKAMLYVGQTPAGLFLLSVCTSWSILFINFTACR